MDCSAKEKTVIDFVLKIANETIHAKKILLFGSRARRDHKEKSDYDFAFFQMSHPEYWAKFVIAVEERAPTLCQIDLVNANEIDKRFQDVIEKEGVLINE